MRSIPPYAISNSLNLILEVVGIWSGPKRLCPHSRLCLPLVGHHINEVMWLCLIQKFLVTLQNVCTSASPKLSWGGNRWTRPVRWMVLRCGQCASFSIGEKSNLKEQTEILRVRSPGERTSRFRMSSYTGIVVSSMLTENSVRPLSLSSCIILSHRNGHSG